MLDSIRNTTNSWATKIFFVILLLCFVFLWGIPQLNIKNESNLLTSGKSTITVDDYRLALADH
ncbi:SurA N-terminal domain-containing protein, partial [Bartonella bacilliformis]|uniref:SurA N-terminal domain-containing protein n=1 Tax=Bartonella bacilliformis TaxID=774 RepID=UPI0039E3D0F0